MRLAGFQPGIGVAHAQAELATPESLPITETDLRGGQTYDDLCRTSTSIRTAP